MQGKEQNNMAKVKEIKEYKTMKDGYTNVKIPVSNKESQVIMELNFNNYVNILSQYLVKYSSNFNVGQMGVASPSAIKHLMTYAIYFYIHSFYESNKERWQ